MYDNLQFSKDIVYYRFNSPLIVVYWLSVDITDFYTKCFIFKMVTFIPQGGYLFVTFIFVIQYNLLIVITI